MSTVFLYNYAGLCLLLIGLHGLIRSSHLLRKILSANLMASGVFLILVVTAYGTDGGQIDPVPHAMVLTGIVVSISTTAVALVLAALVQETSNRLYLLKKRPKKTGGKGRA
ncbi:MAG: NADH-quinone oxidoreductase subunit K [Pseudomonadota bacterium]